MITIKDIANMAGVSRGTVDRVLNNRGKVKPETEKKIREIIEREKFVPSLAGKILAAYKREFRVMFIYIKHINSLFFDNVYKAALTKAGEMKQLGMNIDFVPITEVSIESTIMTMESLLEKADEYDGYVIPVVSSPFEMLVDKLIERKKPIVEYNGKYKINKVVGYVGCDYIRAGRIAAGIAALCSQNRGKIGIFTVTRQNMQSYYERMYGFENEISTKYPEMIIKNRILHDKHMNEKFEAELVRMFEDSEINVLYAVDPGDYSACEIARRIVKDRKIYIITNDLVAGQDIMLKKGVITATITQQPEVQGTESLQMIYDYLALGIKPADKIHYTDLNIIIDQSIEL